MNRTIKSPYKVDHKIYVRLITIFLCTLFLSFSIPTKTSNYLYVCSDIIKNLSYGCIGSTVVAWLIDCANIKNSNAKADRIYDAVYNDLKFRIASFIGLWAQLCTVAFRDENYDKQKDTWDNWYKTTKLNYYKSNPERQEELLSFFIRELSYYTEAVNKSIEHIQSQRYMLTLNDAMNEKMEQILEDFRFEFHALELDLSQKDPSKRFWDHMDAITKDLLNYINNWTDIRYYNSVKFMPYEFFTNLDDVRDAILLSEYMQKVKQKVDRNKK